MSKRFPVASVVAIGRWDELLRSGAQHRQLQLSHWRILLVHGIATATSITGQKTPSYNCDLQLSRNPAILWRKCQVSVVFRPWTFGSAESEVDFIGSAESHSCHGILSEPMAAGPATHPTRWIGVQRLGCDQLYHGDQQLRCCKTMGEGSEFFQWDVKSAGSQQDLIWSSNQCLWKGLRMDVGCTSFGTCWAVETQWDHL